LPTQFLANKDVRIYHHTVDEKYTLPVHDNSTLLVLMFAFLKMNYKFYD